MAPAKFTASENQAAIERLCSNGWSMKVNNRGEISWVKPDGGTSGVKKYHIGTQEALCMLAGVEYQKKQTQKRRNSPTKMMDAVRLSGVFTPIVSKPGKFVHANKPGEYTLRRAYDEIHPSINPISQEPTKEPELQEPIQEQNQPEPGHIVVATPPTQAVITEK